MMCGGPGPIVFLLPVCGFFTVFLLLLPFICTFSEGKKCTGQILKPKILTADNTESVKSCKKRRGKCCSESDDGDFVTWDGGSDRSGDCDFCWSGKSSWDPYDYLEISLKPLGWLAGKIIDKIFDKVLDKEYDKMRDKVLDKEYDKMWDKMFEKKK